ncbi:hypothetical protein [Sinorhizobium americanum]|uniref:Uncharacterized protein n=1 Tax=Sinorhizobium americanum TaxID=194963 RepID=A0A4R2C5J4_9HYPH|nr:hypothetical protein [Sinorhizobium americanum]TCN34119.1 hypothetical protein EV184_102431 [Sinorhizobium americanum]
MKTPWKFLAQLTSRRPSAKAQQSSIGNSADSKAFESEAEHTPALRLSLRVAASPPAHDEDVSVDHGSNASDKAKGDDDVAQALTQAIDAEEAQTTARHDVDHSDAEANSLVPKSAASTKSHAKPRGKRRRGKSANGESTAQSAVAAKPPQSLQPSSSRDLFFLEAATLDEEIKTLRIHLAQKLQLQNGQLKKMLERFDVS